MNAAASHPSLRPIEEILELARWAPSGDNTQPWRFEVTGDTSALVHGSDTRDHCVYDLDGHPSQMAIGAMLETASIAASALGLRMDAVREVESPEPQPRFRLQFLSDPLLKPDKLLGSITRRTVQRRAMSTRRLKGDEKLALERSVGTGYRIVWLEGAVPKLKTARLLFSNAKLRLILPEAYPTHRDVIEWNARFSEDRVPDQALGVDRLTARLMRWAMVSWNRVDFLNRYFAGTWAPRVQMDLLPALACGAHFLIVAETPATSIDSYVAAGRAVQRAWLAATHQQLGMQPEMTPLIFARYVRENRSFSASPGMAERATRLAEALRTLVGADIAARAVFMGRVGAGPAPHARSVRRSLPDLQVARRP